MTTAVLQGWTDRQIIEATIVILGFAAVFVGVIAFAAAMLNQFAYWLEARHSRKTKSSEIVDRCNVYTLRPRPTRLDDIRTRRGDAA